MRATTPRRIVGRTILAVVAAITTQCAAPVEPVPDDAALGPFRLGPRWVVPGGRVTELEFSPDGSLLACGGEQGDVVVLAVRSGAIMGRFDPSWTGACHFAFLPDGEHLAIAADTLTIWDIRSGERLVEEPGGHVVAIAPEGARMAWRLRNGVVAVARLEGHRVVAIDELRHGDGRDNASALAFSPDGSRLAVGTKNGTDTILDLDSGRCESVRRHGDWTAGLIWTAGQDAPSRLGWEGREPLFGEVRQFEGPVFGVSATRDGSRLAIRGHCEVCLPTADGREHRLAGGDGGVAWHPDGRTFAWAFDGEVEVHRPGREAVQVLRPGNRGRISALGLDAAGRLVTADTVHGARFVFEVESDQVRRLESSRLPEDGELLTAPEPRTFELLRSDRYLRDPRLESWRIDKGRAVLQWQCALPASFDLRRAYGLYRTGARRNWPRSKLLQLGRCLLEVDRDRPAVEPLRLSADGLADVSADGDRLVYLLGHGSDFGERPRFSIRSREGRQLAEVRLSMGSCDAALTADGSKVVLAQFQRARVYDAATGEELSTLPAHWRGIHRLADGMMLGVEDSALELWDPELDQVVGRIELDEQIVSATPSADGKRILVDHGNAIRVVFLID